MQILYILNFEVVLCLCRVLTICTWLLTWFSRAILHIKHPQIIPLSWALLMHCVNFVEGWKLRVKSQCCWRYTIREYIRKSHLETGHRPDRRQGKRAALKLKFLAYFRFARSPQNPHTEFFVFYASRGKGPHSQTSQTGGLVKARWYFPVIPVFPQSPFPSQLIKIHTKTTLLVFLHTRQKTNGSQTIFIVDKLAQRQWMQ